MTYTVETLGYDRETMFPNWFRAVMRGEPLCTSGARIEAAQDRVAMRRHIRRSVPSLALVVRDMGAAELSDLIDSLQTLESGNG